MQTRTSTETFDDFHERHLRGRLDGEWGKVAAEGARGLPPLALRLPDGRAYSYLPGQSTVALRAGFAEARTVVELGSGIVFDGKADQPWHRDCGLGGHKHMCPLINGSVFLGPANLETGELRFLPGSWRTAGCSVIDQDSTLGIAVEAEAGDFSIHYGCGMHAGTPPTARAGPFRSSVVFEYGRPARSSDQSQEHHDQLMLEVDASQLRSGSVGS
jgi:hypothetical protein